MAYLKPVSNNARQGRFDKGIDYQGIPGQSVVAVGAARVDAVKSDPGGYGIAIYYTLLDGPAKGQQIFVGHAQPVVKTGQKVAAGQPVATLLAKPLGSATQPGWVEVGLAKDGRPAYGEPDGGKQFQAFLAGAQATTDQAPTPTDTPSPAAVTPPQDVAPPTATQPSGPVPAAPGSQDFTLDHGAVYDTWQQVARQQGLSPETQRMAQLAGGLGGA